MTLALTVMACGTGQTAATPQPTAEPTTAPTTEATAEGALFRGIRESAVLPGRWPAASERDFLEQMLVSDFLSLALAVCVLDEVQAEVSHEEYEGYLERFGRTEANPVYGELIGLAMVACTLRQQTDAQAG
jgi:hypothetical protein